MKTIPFTTQEAGWKIVAGLALIASSFAAAGALVLPFLPTASWTILAPISVGLTLFVWSVFRLIKPPGYDRNWQIAEMVLVPLYSLMLALAASVWVAWLIQHSAQELQEVWVGTLHGTGLY